MRNPHLTLAKPLTDRDTPPRTGPDLICFSHLRWDFVLQRPQHLMQRFAQSSRVFYVEEVIPTDHHLPYLEFHAFEGTSVTAVRPRVPHRAEPALRETLLAGLLDQMTILLGVRDPLLWFYTPMMWPAAAHLPASAIVYDCMDELSAFRFAAQDLVRNEAALMEAADVVFTGGHALYEAKRGCTTTSTLFRPASTSGISIVPATTDPSRRIRLASPRLASALQG